MAITTGGVSVTLAALTRLLSVSAQASSTVICYAKDKAIDVELHGSAGRSVGSAIGGFGGEAEFKVPWMPPAARRVTFEAEHLTQTWYDDREIRLAVSWIKDGKEPSPELTLIIKTRRVRGDDSPYRGQYQLVAHLPDEKAGTKREVQGKIECSAD
ncbi:MULTISPECIES: hypothetical protein [unclassified Bradyrhizobium]|uniref:hypothetical protein n=1 Tax=unclassified Bradyrhizobium TaxID=2631580 RepID=UPI0028EE5678|nr:MULTISPECIES: hypothetical protein [unclassified Bradyrhizobium]